jgi:hypothetical protein
MAFPAISTLFDSVPLLDLESIGHLDDSSPAAWFGSMLTAHFWMIHIPINIITKIDNITLMIGQLPCYDPIFAQIKSRVA